MKPVTVAGVAVRDFLLATVTSCSEGAVRRRPLGQSELVFQAFSIALRRRLARDRGAEAIDSFVASARVRLGILPFEAAATRCVALVRQGLGLCRARRWVLRDDKLVQRLLADLVRSQFLSAAEVDTLVSAAEARLARMFRQIDASRLNPWARFKLGRAMRGMVKAGTDARPVPAPVPALPPAGRSLRAVARFDFGPIPGLIAEPSHRDVCDRAFALAVRARFTGRPDPGQVSQLAEAVSEHPVSRPIPADDVVLQVMHVLGNSPIETDDSGFALEVRLATFARIVDDLGLYDSELEELIHQAEGYDAGRV